MQTICKGFATRGRSHSKHPHHFTPLSLVDTEGSDAVDGPFVVMTSQSTPRSASMEYWDELWALEADLVRDGFRRFRDIGPLYNRDADTAEPFTRRATGPILVTSTPRGGLTRVAAVNIGPRIQRIEPIQDSTTRSRYLSLITARRPITLGDSPPPEGPPPLARPPKPEGPPPTARPSRQAGPPPPAEPPRQARPPKPEGTPPPARPPKPEGPPPTARTSRQAGYPMASSRCEPGT